MFLIIHAVGFLFCTLLHARICKSSLTILRGLCLFDDSHYLSPNSFQVRLPVQYIGYVTLYMSETSI